MDMTALRTSFSRITAVEPLLTGDERYPVVGHLLTEFEAIDIQRHLAGYRKHWHCLEKAQFTARFLQRGVVVVGRMHLLSGDRRSTYGYDFNPPYEFHAWVQLPNGIIDVGLPGVIDKGLTTSDVHGPYLVERVPIILAGKPLDWMSYQPREIIG